MNEFHCLLVLYIWKSLKNTGPDVVGGKSGTYVAKLRIMRDFSSSAFKTGIKNEYPSESPTANANILVYVN